MHSTALKTKGKIAALLAAFAVVLSGAISPLTAQAEPGNPQNVESWSELEVALNQKAPTITITKDLAAVGGKSLNIDYPVTIQGNATIYRDYLPRLKGEYLQPMFTVQNDGNLTLAGDIKLSGKAATCSSGEQLTLEQVAQTTTEEQPNPATKNIWFRSDSGYLNWGRTNSKLQLDSVQTPFNMDGSKLWHTYLSINRYAVARDSDYAFLPESSDHHYLELRDENGNAVSSVTKGKTYVLFDTLHNVYVKNDGGLVPGTADISSALKFTAEFDPGDDPGTSTVTTTVWVIDGVTYVNQDEAETALATYNANQSGECTPSCSVITTAMFNGSRGNEKGFFVQVNGGTFNLTGNAELRDLITGPNVSYVAPVVAKGGTVNIEGGAITHNSAGYSANNADSGLPANQIGREAQDGWNEEGKIAGYRNTESAGAIILTEGSTGVMSGGSIDGNRGDTGAIVVQGKPDRDRNGGENRNVENGNATSSTLTISGGVIDNNVGIHHAGAIYVFNGAKVEMTAGSITNNFAWNKGGAVWASEESYASAVWDAKKKGKPVNLPVGEATFILKGGTLSGNMAVNRGGAIEVMSDHVALLGGQITNNYSRVLGGAIYVEGDSSDRLYQLFIAKGCITNNHAVPAQNNATSAPLYRTLNTGTECNFSNAMNGTTAGDVSDHKDYNNYYGYGGGLWLCSFGGNTTFAVPNTEVTLWQNDAATKGQDLVVRPLRSASTNGFSFLDLGSQSFVSEDNGAVYSNETVQGRVLTGPIHATAQTTGTCPADGVTISGNVAPVGGGIAGNGNVIFGDKAEIAQAFATLKLTKAWSSELKPEEVAPNGVTFKLYAEINGQRVELPEYEVTLDGTVDADSENTAVRESEPWVAEMGMPLSVAVGESVYPLFTFDYTANLDGSLNANNTPDDTSDDLNPSKLTDLVVIAEAVRDGKLTTADAKIGDWKLIVEESIDGVVQEEAIDLGNGVLENLEYLGYDESALKDMNNKVVGTLTSHKVGMSFASGLGNDVKPSVEKYVNKDVDAHLVEFDKVVTYDILAYVPLDADSIEINDKLVDSLEFADANGKATTKASDSVSAIVVKASNNHTAVTGTVASTDGVALGDAAKPTISGKNLKIEIADATAYRGKWIQVTFNAKYTEAAIKAAKVSPAADNADVSDNGTVISGIATHDGTANTASYKIKANNKWSSDYVSNTVTHDAENVQLKATKVWQDRNGNELGEWPDGAKVTFALMKGDIEIETKTLSAAGTVTFTTQPKLKGVTYKVVEKSVTGVDAVQAGDPQVAGNVWTFTNKLQPDTPQVEKYINKDVHQEVALDEVFTYDIIAYVTKDATKLTISDELVKNLEFADDASAVVVADLGKVNNHKTNGTYTSANADATVSAAGTPVTATATISGKKLSVVVDDVEGQGLRGHYVRVTFRAKLPADAEYVTITDNGSVLSDKEHTGVDNTASYVVDTAHGPYDEVTSNTVTVKPNEPEIEKYVNQAVHKDITLDEVFTYDLIAWVTNDADTVTITDELMGDLAFASDADTVKVEALGADDNHKVVNNVDGSSAGNADATVAAAGTAVEDADVTISGQTLTVTIADATALRGQWVRVTFDAKIADGKTLVDVKAHYEAIDAAAAGTRAEPNVGNAPVLSDENHAGLPNTASYEIGVKQAVLDENGNPTVDENGNLVEETKPKYSDESNTVTVKPKHEIEFSKWQFGIKNVEIPGAEIVIRDVKGNEVERWTSTDEVHTFYLAEGEYEFEEINAPAGLDTITTKVTFTVDENGTVTVTNAEEVTNGRVTVIDHNHLILEDMPGNITKDGMLIAFAKVDEHMEPLPGAKLKLTDKVANVVLDEWTTDGTEHVYGQILPGTYVLTETAAPNGYELADPIEFEVMPDGTVMVNGKALPVPVVTMIDKVDTEKKPGDNPSKSATPSAPNVRTRSLVNTGSPAAIALLTAFALLGAGAGLLVVRRRRS